MKTQSNKYDKDDMAQSMIMQISESDKVLEKLHKETSQVQTNYESRMKGKYGCVVNLFYVDLKTKIKSLRQKINTYDNSTDRV